MCRKLQIFFERLMYYAGPLFVVVAITLLVGVISLHFLNSIPFYSGYWSIGGLIHLIMSCYFTFCVIFNYVMAVKTSPGRTKTYQELGMNEAQIQECKDNTEKLAWHENGLRHCEKCDKPKPPRARHCGVCGTCVLKYDHHCPWIANCVGHQNHHYFVLFLLYLWFGCAYVSATSFLPFYVSSNPAILVHSSFSRGTIFFGFILSTSVFLAIFIMLSWQVYLLMTGQTTVEFYQNGTMRNITKKVGRVWRNPFDLGWGNNFQIFFGIPNAPYWFCWLVPWGVVPLGDGYQFQTRFDSVV